MACPLLAVRGNTGLDILATTDNFKEHNVVYRDTSPGCRSMAFSDDGEYFAYCNSESFKVLQTSNWSPLINIAKGRTTEIAFSPKSTYVVFWEAFYTTPANPNGSPNLQIYRLSDHALIKEYIQKSKDTWLPQWSSDEYLCSRIVTNEVHFFEEGKITSVDKKLVMQNIASYSIAPCGAPYKVAAFARGSKGSPSFVRLFEYPKFDNSAALANRSFFRAEKARLFWNRIGTAVLVLASSEVDKTGGSYYGEQSLHFMSTKGEGNLVPFVRKGPIYSVDWHSSGSFFAVVQGYMPARAVLFNLKCEPIFDFGTGPRNLCEFNPHGNILCIAGFSNLTGIVEMWNVKEKKLVSKSQFTDTTDYQWSPNGYHFTVATVAPRLRVGNCYKICHYTGTVIHEFNALPNCEIWQVCWQAAKDEKYPAPSVATSLVQNSAKPKAEAYRPPSARAAGIKSSLKLHEEEAPQNVHQGELTGAALKNKKKREARAKAKQDAGEGQQAQGQISSTPSEEGGGEREKKMKNLRKKLRQIEELKEKKNQGKTLEVNQLEKLKMENDLLTELKNLELGAGDS